VAELVTEGRTARQIDDSLFLSVKTVERHLSNISAKLGTRSRVALAALFIRNEEGAAGWATARCHRMRGPEEIARMHVISSEPLL
jgi:hypothetical protein